MTVSVSNVAQVRPMVQRAPSVVNAKSSAKVRDCQCASIAARVLLWATRHG